jgi:transcription elongation factor Elf1
MKCPRCKCEMVDQTTVDDEPYMECENCGFECDGED